MKKSQITIIAATVIFLSIILGIFIGRGTASYRYIPAKNTLTETTNTDGRIDINTATLKQLMLLPGIGEILAGRILDYRTENGPFTDISDIMSVEGIGQAKFQQIQNYIKAGG